MQNSHSYPQQLSPEAEFWLEIQELFVKLQLEKKNLNKGNSKPLPCSASVAVMNWSKKELTLSLCSSYNSLMNGMFIIVPVYTW